LVIFLATALTAYAQLEGREVTASSAPYAPRFAASIKVDARLVEVPVIVRDGKGRAVAGLKREDFEIRDEGRKREVSSFVVETSERARASAIHRAAVRRFEFQCA
jgi:hypothetical protein